MIMNNKNKKHNIQQTILHIFQTRLRTRLRCCFTSISLFFTSISLDGSQNSHTVFHEIFWASYSKKNSWTLVRRINITADNMGQDTDLDNHGYPPELPPPSTIFTLPNKFKILNLGLQVERFKKNTIKGHY